MFQTLKNAWHIADLRKKILYTLMILVLFRLGTAVPVPFLDAQVLQQMLQNPANAGNLLGYLDILSGGAFARATIFALSITPYITSSIVIQLLTVAIPALERMAKEGEDGRRKINKITRYAVSYTHLDVYKRQDLAREAMRLAAHKLPIKCKFVAKETEEKGSEE